MGYLLSFEGIDGSGKSTQAQLAADELTSRGFDVVHTFEPGDTELGKQLREILLHSGGMSERAEALLYAADRAEHAHAVIVPALARGAIVITDRFIDSSVAYQGAGRVLAGADIEGLSAWATEDMQADASYVFDLPIEVAAQRLGKHPDRLESEAKDFHQRVRQGFLDIAAANPQRVRVFDATLPVQELHASVMADVLAVVGQQ